MADLVTNDPLDPIPVGFRGLTGFEDPDRRLQRRQFPLQFFFESLLTHG